MVTREKMEMNPKQERKLRETKENAGQMSMENKEIAIMREKCSWEKSEGKGKSRSVSNREIEGEKGRECVIEKFRRRMEAERRE